MKIAHVALWTRDLIGAAAFWEDYFEQSSAHPIAAFAAQVSCRDSRNCQRAGARSS